MTYSHMTITASLHMTYSHMTITACSFNDMSFVTNITACTEIVIYLFRSKRDLQRKEKEKNERVFQVQDEW